MSRWTPALLAALLLFGCASPPTTSPPHTEPPAALPQNTEPPAASPHTEPPPSASSHTEPPAAEPSAEVSPVTARVEARGEPPLVAPVHVHRTEPPLVTVTFSGPVDRQSVHPALVHELDLVMQGERYPATYRWAADRTLEIAAGDLGGEARTFRVDLGDVRDLAGRAVPVPEFRFTLTAPGRTEIWRLPVDGRGEPERVFSRDDDLIPAATSPDGRYFLIWRTPWSPAVITHSRQRYPYLYDRELGTWQLWPLVEADSPCWTGDSPFPWVNGHQRLAADGRIETLSLPAAGGDTLWVTAAAPGGRWVAALRDPGDVQRPRPGQVLAMDLLLLDRASGAIESYPRRVGAYYSPDHGLRTTMRWSPDGRHLAVVSRSPAADEPGRAGAMTLYLLTPGAPAAPGEPPGWRELLRDGEWWALDWSPYSRMLAVDPVGVVSLTGEAVLPGAVGVWSPDGQRLLEYRPAGRSRDRAGYLRAWDLQSGPGPQLPLPGELETAAYVLGWSPDGRAVYVGKYSEPGQR